jgi:hypothetical protein
VRAQAAALRPNERAAASTRSRSTCESRTEKIGWWSVLPARNEAGGGSGWVVRL